jgi:hypothetical protein
MPELTIRLHAREKFFGPGRGTKKGGRFAARLPAPK